MKEPSFATAGTLKAGDPLRPQTIAPSEDIPPEEAELFSDQADQREHPNDARPPGHLSVVQEGTEVETIARLDALNRGTLTMAVADLLTIRKDQHPLAMALFGAWGTGKSSFVEFVKRELEKRHWKPFRVAEFNAWRNERVDNIGAALAQAVVECLVADKSVSQQVTLAIRLAQRRKERLRKALSNDVAKLKAWALTRWVWLSATLTYLAWPLAVALIFVVLLVESSASKWLLGSVGATLTGLAGLFSIRSALSKELLDWFKRLAKDQKFTFRLLPDYSEKLGSYHEMGRTLEDLCALTLSEGENGRTASLLLVIDDLDRCSPETIKQVFDAVRLVTNIPQVVVLVALDERIAYSAVAKHYSEYGFSDRETAQVARDYMSKVFNVFITLADAPQDSIENYVRARLFGFPGPLRPAATPRKVEPMSASDPDSMFEMEAFASFVKDFRLANPRELWRLRQAWSLLKGFALPEYASKDEVRTWMRHMFFREMFLRGTADQRKVGKAVLEKLIAGSSLTPSEELWTPSLTQAARELSSEFLSRDGAVMSVLLPAAPAELKVATKT